VGNLILQPPSSEPPCGGWRAAPGGGPQRTLTIHFCLQALASGASSLAFHVRGWLADGRLCFPGSASPAATWLLPYRQPLIEGTSNKGGAVSSDLVVAVLGTGSIGTRHLAVLGALPVCGRWPVPLRFQRRRNWCEPATRSPRTSRRLHWKARARRSSPRHALACRRRRPGPGLGSTCLWRSPGL